MKKIYIVTRYHKTTVFDKNDNLVWRWTRVESIIYTNAQKALRYFRACNTADYQKAVLRVRRGGKR